MITIGEALVQGTEVLSEAGIEGARRDAQVLLTSVLGEERSVLYTYPERELTSEQEEQYRTLLQRRQLREPVAYILGHKEFFGLDLLVDRRVLIPRPETELLVEMALSSIHARLNADQLPIVADIGTGSGAIPIALAVTEPRLPTIYAADISTDALDVARLNARRHHVEERICFLQGDLLAPLPQPVDLLLANLPYVGTEEMESLAPDVRSFEPAGALFSGPNGLDLLHRFSTEARQFGILKSGAEMVLEIGHQQAGTLTVLLRDIFPGATVAIKQDYAGFERFVYVHL